MAYWLPGAVKRPISTNYTPRNRPRTLGVVLHVTAAPNAVSQFGWFNNPAAQASSHLHVDIYGRTEQYVDLDFIAWCQRAGNIDYISIETQGGATGEWTPAQAAEIMRILRVLAEHYGFSIVDTLTSQPGRVGIGLHRYGCDPFRVPGGNIWGPTGKVCPGGERQAQFKNTMLPAMQKPTPTPTPEEDNDMPAQVNQFIRTADQPLEKGKEVVVLLNDKGDNITAVFGDHRRKLFDAEITLQLGGLPKGEPVQVRARAVRISDGALGRSYYMREIIGTSGDTFGGYSCKGYLEKGWRMRFFITSHLDNVVIKQAAVTAFEWNA